VSLTLHEARARAELVHDVRISVHLDLTGTDDFTVEATVRFGCRTPGRSTFLELADAQDVTLDGEPAPYDGRRITLAELAGANEVRVTARLPYVTDGDGMTVLDDPVDGERYVCALTSMDITQRVLPCFDQPDLKTVFTVSATVPEHWTVLANGVATPLDQRGDRAGARSWRFTPTPPISTYLFTLCAGPWVSVTWEEPYDGAPGGTLPFGWHARASQRAELERDIEELRRVTSASFQHFTRVFDEPYAFGDYQQVFTPRLNWSAMEFPGCVAFRDELLTPGEPTAIEHARRTAVIAHEMAHMWFGDLVTMRWWEDSWLNESFADYMGYQVARDASGLDGAWTTASISRKPTAFHADRRRSTHPIAEDPDAVVDVDTAFGNFDMITYAKGNAVLTQLVTWLGEEEFLAGVNAYLSQHAFGNATLADFLDALDSVTDRDVRAWAQAWLRTTGYDRVEVTRDADVPVVTRAGTRPHRLSLAAYDDRLQLVDQRLVDVADVPLHLDDLAGRVVLPNAGDEAYAALAPDARSWSALTGGLSRIASPVSRAVVWRTAAELAEAGEATVDDLVALAVRQLPGEHDPVVLEGALALVERVVRMYGDPAALPRHLAAMAALGESVLGSGRADLVPAAARVLAAASTDADLLGSWLDGTSQLPGADQSVRWAIVQRLASLGEEGRIGVEMERDHSASGHDHATTARAAVPTPEAKAAAWERLVSGDLSNRGVTATAAGLWTWDQAELVTPLVLRYPVDCLDLGRRSGQAMGQVIGRAFPWLPLHDETREDLRAALAAALADDVPTVLARHWNDALDDLDRVLATRS